MDFSSILTNRSKYGGQDTAATLLNVSRSVITSLLQKLPNLFSRNKTAEPTLLPTLESAISSLAMTGGKIVCSSASLPTWGPGRLFLRDKNDLHGIETEKKLFQTEHPGWKKLAGKMVESGVGIDFFIAAAGGKYMDIATIGKLGEYLRRLHDADRSSQATQLQFPVEKPISTLISLLLETFSK